MAVEVSIEVQGVDEFAAALQRLDRSLQVQVRKMLHDWALRVAEQAKRKAPYRTGYLQSTIYAEVKDWVAEIGAKATYSYFVEFGTRYMAAQPYLYPAIQEYLPQLEFIITSAIGQAKAEAGLQ